jgi:hypothetical protein
MKKRIFPHRVLGYPAKSLNLIRKYIPNDTFWVRFGIKFTNLCLN